MEDLGVTLYNIYGEGPIKSNFLHLRFVKGVIHSIWQILINNKSYQTIPSDTTVCYPTLYRKSYELFHVFVNTNITLRKIQFVH